MVRRRSAKCQRAVTLSLRFTRREAHMITRPRFSRAIRGLVFAAATIGGVADCSLEVGTNTPSTMVKESGDTQSAAANTQLPVPFTILVVNQFGEMLHNVPVTWQITSGGGS